VSGTENLNLTKSFFLVLAVTPVDSYKGKEFTLSTGPIPEPLV
jgi:hypothetical protein